jgi:hypothetical protein
MTVSDELKNYWKENNLPVDGGASETFNKAQIGRFYFRYPNLNGTALLLHDINHFLTGYPTTWKGEFQVSAWELSSGGRKGFPTTWIYPISLAILGLLFYPLQTVSAYKNGKNQKNAFVIHGLTDIFSLTIDELRNYSTKKTLPPT